MLLFALVALFAFAYAQPPQDCIVSDWSSFGNQGSAPCTGCPPLPPCSLTCGGGSRTDTRVVLIQAAYGGQACPVLTRTVSCNTQACPVDCVYGQWTSFDDYTTYSFAFANQYTFSPETWNGVCSVTCGSGTRRLFRQVITQASNGGVACVTSGANSQTERLTSCSNPSCPIDCVMSQWTTYDDYPTYYQQVGGYLPYNPGNWGGICSQTCGGGIRNSFRYVITQSAFGGRACPDLSRTVLCNVQPCAGDCYVSSWRTYDSYALYTADTLVSSQVVVPIDQFQGPCSATCGTGYRLQFRYIVTPASNGGAACPAVSTLTQVVSCNTNPCPIDAVVSQWALYDSYSSYYTVFNGYNYLVSQILWTGTCSVTCGTGVRTAYRYIVTPAQYGGASAPALTQTVSCNNVLCPIDGVVSSWTSYNTYQLYVIDFSTDQYFITQSTSWQGVCTRTCGGGFRQVFRRVITYPVNGGAVPSGPDAYIRTEPCNTFNCPIDVVLSEWATYTTYSSYSTVITQNGGFVFSQAAWQGSCSVSCGGGVQRAFRYIVVHGQFGGIPDPDPANVPGSPLVKYVSCNQQSCPTDCVVSSWVQYDSYSAYVTATQPFGPVDSIAQFNGLCSNTCGGGTRFLYRYIITPSNNAGRPCPALFQQVTCNPQPCPVDCVLGQWTSYSSYNDYLTALGSYAVNSYGWPGLCSVSCGGGVRTEYRSVVIAAQNGGAVCGSTSRTVTCATNNCPVDCLVSNWVSYNSYQDYIAGVGQVNPIPQTSYSGSCSVSCGGGVRSVYRSILRAPLYGGAACPLLSQSMSCNVFPCPADCVISQWATFDSYSVYQSTFQSYVSQLLPPQVWSGTCNVQCGGGSRTQFRYITRYQANGGAACPALQRTISCNTTPCPTPCTVSQWAAVDPTTGRPSQCTNTCGGGVLTYSRSVIVAAGYGGAACPPLTKTEACNTQACPRDCVVSQWTAYDDYDQYCTVSSSYGSGCVPRPLWYGLCSATCGGGVRNIYRTILTQPANGGVACPVLVKQVGCNTRTCPGDCVVSDWVQYTNYQTYVNDAIRYGVPYTTLQGFNGQCSASCGTGYRTFYRYVVTPASFNGQPCPALSELRTCNTFPCPIDCTVTQWAGFDNYDVYVSVMSVYGPVDSRATWRGACSATCGGGTKFFYRQIVTQAQYGGVACPVLTQQIICNTRSCPVNCVVSQWTDIGSINDNVNSYCSASCGGGTRAQIRVISTYPSVDGSQCPALTRVLQCNTQACPIDCQVSSWAVYSSYSDYYAIFQNYFYAVTPSDFAGTCSKTCGNGIQYQYRYIVVNPAYGGRACPVLAQAVSCNVAFCPGDCAVSTWASYSSFSENELISIFPGLNPSQFPSIGTCSKSCGGGTQILFRKIINQPLNGGQACPDLTLSVACNTFACPIDCVTTQWAQYDSYSDYFSIYGGRPEYETAPAWRGQCSNSCGGGVRAVYRRVTVQPQNGGRACPALSKTIVCNTNNCPVNCVLSDWNQFSIVAPQCSRTCGGGVAQVSRSVITYPAYNGSLCGSLTKSVACNTQPCPIDCQVSQWSQFDSYATYYAVFQNSYGSINQSNFAGVCTTTCGGGVRSLYRKVIVDPQYGGRACPALISTVGCNVNPCPQDCVVSQWALYGVNGFVSLTSNAVVALSSQCTVTCGGGVRTLYREILTPAAYGGQACPSLTLQGLCNDFPCPNDCVLSDWAYYNVYDVQFSTLGQCTATCGTGTRIQYRSILSQPVNGGVSCGSLTRIVNCNTQACPVDCALSAWADAANNGQVQACSATCGTGTKLQTRSVLVYPLHGGAACDVLSQQVSCGTDPCPGDCVVSQWATDGECTATCGGGVGTYVRRVLTAASNSGAACPSLARTFVCNPTPCPVPCVVGSWTDFISGSCSASCGGGVKQQLRLILQRPAYGGAACPLTIRSVNCSTVPCPTNCIVSQWAQTESCSVTCGGGVTTLTRTVVSPASAGGLACPSLTREIACNIQPCAVDCRVSEWVSFTNDNNIIIINDGQNGNNLNIDAQCSVSCGGGVRLQYRAILVNQAYGGAACPLLTRTVACNSNPCPVDCLLSSWSFFSATSYNNNNTTATTPNTSGSTIPTTAPNTYTSSVCSATCGGGIQARFRYIITPASYGGQTCGLLALAEEIACNTQGCPGSCIVSNWTSTTQCSRTCGGGVLTQTRTVLTQPSNGGAPCPGLTQQVACNIQPCATPCVVSEWSDYNRDFDSPYLVACSATCGGGFKYQFRTVLAYSTNGGQACASSLSRTIACNSQTCPIDGVVGQWVQYFDYNTYFTEFYSTNVYYPITTWGGLCSATCGGGNVRQFRKVLVYPTNGGLPLPPLTQLVTCNSQPCPVNCVVSDWVPTAFGCTKTCGYGTWTYQRTVLIAPNNGGAGCPPLAEERECAAQPCPNDCVVGDWANYNPTSVLDVWYPFNPNCSVNCGGGVLMQIRPVLRPASNGGAPCPVLTRQVSCNTFGCPVHCVVSSWSSYGAGTGLDSCTATCGGGYKPIYRTILVNPQNNGTACPELVSSTACNEAPCPCPPPPMCGVTCAYGFANDIWGCRTCNCLSQPITTQLYGQSTTPGINYCASSPCPLGYLCLNQPSGSYPYSCVVDNSYNGQPGGAAASDGASSSSNGGVIAGAVIAAVVAVALIALVAVIIVRRQNAAASKRLSTGSLDASSSEMVVSTTVPEYRNPAYLGVSSGITKGDYADPNAQAVASTQYTDEGF